MKRDLAKQLLMSIVMGIGFAIGVSLINGLVSLLR